MGVKSWALRRDLLPAGAAAAAAAAAATAAARLARGGRAAADAGRLEVLVQVTDRRGDQSFLIVEQTKFQSSLRLPFLVFIIKRDVKQLLQISDRS